MKEAILKNTGERIAVREAYPIGDDIIPFAQYYTTEDGTIYIDTDLDFNTKKPMTPTKDQQAQEYAEKKYSELMATLEHGTCPMFRSLVKGCYLDGYTACEQSMWRSVGEEEPPIGNLILCRDTDRVALAYFDGEAITEAVFPNEDVAMPFWMPIPSLPETNTK